MNRESCPTCGIELWRLDEAHFTALPDVDECPDASHGTSHERLTRLEKAMERELEKRRRQSAAGEKLAVYLEEGSS